MTDALTFRFRTLPWLIQGLLLGGCFGLAACAGPQFVTEDVDAAYRQAVADAKVAAPSEISTRLTPITPANEALIWQGQPGQSRLLVVTWGGADAVDALPGDTVRITGATWVTVAPTVQRRCQALSLPPDRLVLRLQQLLGLPPNANYDRFFALWVRPRDLFRPCPDPAISDRECERGFPQSSRFLTIAPAHKAWFRRMRRTMYDVDGYPWTRLGYTYDWGRPDDEFGISEFVIRAGARVVVQSITGTQAYCTAE